MQVTQHPFVSPEWDVVVLRPSGLRPKSQPLNICEPRDLITEKGAPPPRWVRWTCEGVHYLHPPGKPSVKRPPFRTVTLRPVWESVSSLAMVINAHWKLQQYIAQPDVRPVEWHIWNVGRAISELYQEIVFIPEAFGRLNLLPYLSPISSYESNDSDSEAEEDQEEDPWTAVAAPQEPAEDGLTDAEREAVVRNVCTTSGEERGKWALVMMFGTRGKLAALICMYEH